MIQLFLKNKIAVGLTAVVLAGTIGMTIGGVVLGDKAKTRFPSDGYVLDVAVTEDGQQTEVKTMNFASGSALVVSKTTCFLFQNLLKTLYL